MSTGDSGISQEIMSGLLSTEQETNKNLKTEIERLQTELARMAAAYCSTIDIGDGTGRLSVSGTYESVDAVQAIILEIRQYSEATGRQNAEIERLRAEAGPYIDALKRLNGDNKRLKDSIAALQACIKDKNLIIKDLLGSEEYWRSKGVYVDQVTADEREKADLNIIQRARESIGEPQ
jgi:hypothetical protein